MKIFTIDGIISFVKKHYKDLVLLIVIIIAIEWWQSRSLTTGPIPEPLKSQPLPLLSGHQTQLWQSGKTTLLYVFAPWCIVCKASADNLNRLMQTDLNVLSLALSWEHADAIQSFVEETGLKTPVIIGEDKTGSLLNVSAYPSYFLIDGKGEIVKSWSGYTTTPSLWLRTTFTQWLAP